MNTESHSQLAAFIWSVADLLRGDLKQSQYGRIGTVGFEILFNRHFYKFEPPRPLEAIDANLKACTDRIKTMIEELSA